MIVALVEGLSVTFGGVANLFGVEAFRFDLRRTGFGGFVGSPISFVILSIVGWILFEDFVDAFFEDFFGDFVDEFCEDFFEDFFGGVSFFSSLSSLLSFSFSAGALLRLAKGRQVYRLFFSIYLLFRFC